MTLIEKEADEAQRREVIARELAWHEVEAERRYGLDSFLYAPPAFDHIVKNMLDFLGGKPGASAVDMACGEGKETLAMAQRGWVVFSLDLSHVQLLRAREMIEKTNPDLQVHFIQANAEQLPFARNSVQIMYGKAIVHHLDLMLSPREIDRVLQENGRAAFAEPMAHHPLIWLGRRLTPKMRTVDEHPLTYSEFKDFLDKFEQGTMEEDFLFTPLAYIFRIFRKGETLFRKTHRILVRFDKWLLRHFNFLKPLAWYDSVYVQKGQNHEF
jgi:SAM-dependent methyltransferase